LQSFKNWIKIQALGINPVKTGSQGGLRFETEKATSGLASVKAARSVQAKESRA
jgi:hypothetical protein